MAVFITFLQPHPSSPSRKTEHTSSSFLAIFSNRQITPSPIRASLSNKTSISFFDYRNHLLLPPLQAFLQHFNNPQRCVSAHHKFKPLPPTKFRKTYIVSFL
ncbi:hypothetical protein I3843_06G158300 [Carya illinoinensis]|nr:hypothetical protein I3843_06G158300 [Carya illinoinensis]